MNVITRVKPAVLARIVERARKSEFHVAATLGFPPGTFPGDPRQFLRGVAEGPGSAGTM